MYEELPGESETSEESDTYDGSGYLLMRSQNQPQRDRSETSPPSMGAQEKFKSQGRAPNSVYKSKGVTASPDVPPLPPNPNPPKTHLKCTPEDLQQYASIEEVETVLKVTEPLKKVCPWHLQGRGHPFPSTLLAHIGTV